MGAEPAAATGHERRDSVVTFVVRAGREAAWAPLAVVVLHALGGRLLGHEPYVDPVMHLLGGAAAAYFFRRCAVLADGRLGVSARKALDLVAFGLACAAALCWEVGELASDRLLGTHAQGAPGDTERDLALGVCGALACLVSMRLARRSRAHGARG